MTQTHPNGRKPPIVGFFFVLDMPAGTRIKLKAISPDLSPVEFKSDDFLAGNIVLPDSRTGRCIGSFKRGRCGFHQDFLLMAQDALLAG